MRESALLACILTYKPKLFRIYDVNRSQLHEFTSWLGKRSYKARLDRLGLNRLQEIARENGKKGGRPSGTGKVRAKTRQGKTKDGGVSTEI
jgi:hypothetical protein